MCCCAGRSPPPYPHPPADHHARASSLQTCGHPNCLYALGETRQGIWGPKPAALAALGPDPTLRQRDPTLLPAGLRNLGATCYLNALVHVLYFNLPLRCTIYGWEPPPLGGAGGGARPSLSASDLLDIRALRDLFASLQLSTSSSIDTRAFVDRFKLEAGVQQDATEFSKVLLSHVERIFEKSTHLPQVARRVVSRLLAGVGQDVTFCTRCKNRTLRPNPFYELQLPVAGMKTVEAALEALLASEELSGDNAYACDTCSVKTTARRTFELTTPPEVLNLQLLRFVYDQKTANRKKVKDAIVIPDLLDLSALMGRAGGGGGGGPPRPPAVRADGRAVPQGRVRALGALRVRRVGQRAGGVVGV